MPLLRVRRDDLSSCDLAPEPVPDAAALDDGEALLLVERFALTANNVTYGALGDAFGYFKLFPDGEDGWARVPAWGHARVVASRAEGIEEGARFSGLVPMGSHFVATTTVPGSMPRRCKAALRARSEAPLP